MTDAIDSTSHGEVDRRLKLGIALLVLSILLPIAGVPAVVGLGISTATTTAVSGALLVTGEILGLVAVAVMGKPGFLYVKGVVSGLLKRYGPPQRVSRLRYNIGLVMFAVPLLVGWAWPYAAELVSAATVMPLAIAILGDILWVASLFVLGGDFWDKLTALFVQSIRVESGQRVEGKR